MTSENVRKITEQHGDEFDIFYYLSDCPAPRVSYTELESAIKLDPRGKKIEHLNFY